MLRGRSVLVFGTFRASEEESGEALRGELRDLFRPEFSGLLEARRGDFDLGVVELTNREVRDLIIPSFEAPLLILSLLKGADLETFIFNLRTHEVQL